jgi:hypothetical protein
MEDVAGSLQKLNLAQMLLAWAFVGCYALALGGMLGATGSLRSAAAALVSAVLFCVFADNWVHAALLVMCAVAGMGLFVAAAWLLARTSAWLVRRGQPAQRPAAAPLPAPRPRPAAALRALWRSLA